ncbi:MAG: puo 1 [Bacteroidetes bacterium]|nr:puo 1 [Bacteroidota bacterium]
MNDADIIIVGAGITGLTVARQLSRAGKKVLILEGRDRLGGRMHTIHGQGHPIETGAEFIHGDLEATFSLLREYDIAYHKIGGEFWRVGNGKFKEEDDFVEHRELLHKHLDELRTDMTVDDFLNRHFPDELYTEFKDQIRKYVEGYDSADASRASAFAFRDEFGEGEEDQYRIDGGYSVLIDAIAKECFIRKVDIQTSAVVKEIKWSAGKVKVKTADKKTYTAGQVVITVPLGILADEESEAGIVFKPALQDQVDAVRNMGFGHVVKIALELRETFWQSDGVKKHLGRKPDKLGFLFTDAPIPTWWTQHPVKSNLLTGWLAGPPAAQLKHADDETLLQMAVSSLGYIFQMTHTEIKAEITGSHIFNWTNDPFTLGAYAYKTLHTTEAIKILEMPVEHTIFFAGEALYPGTEMGTVEAAIKNAMTVSSMI